MLKCLSLYLNIEPKIIHITENDRVYFTHKNGIRIDKYMYFINNKVEEKYKPYLLAPLLIECSTIIPMVSFQHIIKGR